MGLLKWGFVQVAHLVSEVLSDDRTAVFSSDIGQIDFRI